MLGPVLFDLYIRSIYQCVRAFGFNIVGYADDHQIIKSFCPTDQCKLLSVQIGKCFSAIKRWMTKYFLQLNDSKTQMIVNGSNKVLNVIQLKGITLCSGATIRFISNVKNLGIHMDNRLS